MPGPIFIVDIGPDGAVAVHPLRVELPALIAPVPLDRKDKDLNTLRQHLVAIGCMRLPHRSFEFDSSFIGPQSAGRFTKFAGLMTALKEQDEANPKRFPPVNLFGHADPTGDDAYNKLLSGRRARAVYGLLTRNKKIWNELYNIPYGGDRWGLRSIRLMLSIPLRQGEQPFYTGPLETPTNPQEKAAVEQQTRDAVKAYQTARGLPNTGFPGDKTRDALFEDYMDAICRDARGAPFKLDPKSDFIGRGKDKDLKADVQGCSEFNPVFLLSRAEEDLMNSSQDLHEARNALYASDRRVVAYVFKHGSEVDPSKWPCPSAIDPSTALCKRRFWSDHEKRRKPAEERRTFGEKMEIAVEEAPDVVVFRPVEETGNTMACRFYHGFAANSPCEAGVKEWIVRFRMAVGVKNAAGKRKFDPIANRRYVVMLGETQSSDQGEPTTASPVIRGTTGSAGEIRVPVFSEHVRMTVKLDAWDPLFPEPPKKESGNSASDGAETAPEKPPEGVDTDKFADEDKFMTFVLDGGELKKMSEGENDLPSKQRLHNLGAGPRDLQKWTDQQFRRAVKEYRITRGIGKPDDPIDDDLREKIRFEHDLEGSKPVDPEDLNDNDDVNT